MVIFQNYSLDLDAVQKIYEKHKHGPALPRNAPPVAGDIMWARQLLRRIEEPMRKFATNEAIMRSKESKRVVKTYNTVAKAGRLRRCGCRRTKTSRPPRLACRRR